MSIADHEPTIEGYCGETDITLGCSCGWAQPWWNYRTQKLDGPTWIEHVQADSLDAAWSEAEAALPEGWPMRLSNGGHPDRYAATATRPDDGWEPQKDIRATGPTPAAALRALAAKLREAQG